MYKPHEPCYPLSEGSTALIIEEGVMSQEPAEKGWVTLYVFVEGERLDKGRRYWLRSLPEALATIERLNHNDYIYFIVHDQTDGQCSFLAMGGTL
jgi:hypothetical protein